MDFAVINIASWGLSCIVGLISGFAFMGGWCSWEAAVFLLITRLRGIKGIGGFTVAAFIGRYEGYALFFWTIVLGALLVKRWVLTADNATTAIFWVAALVAAGWTRPKAERIIQSAVGVRRILAETNPGWGDGHWKEATTLAKMFILFLLPFFLMVYLAYLLLR